MRRADSGGGGDAGSADEGPAHSRPASAGRHSQGLRASISSISGALASANHRLTSNASKLLHATHHQRTSAQRQQPQITTTCESPLRRTTTATTTALTANTSNDSFDAQHEDAIRALQASGRRLSQLFLPQATTVGGGAVVGVTSNALIDELGVVPPHLLALYASSGGAVNSRASWADVSLLAGHLSRQSFDSSYNVSRHSFDARSLVQDQTQASNDNDHDDRPSESCFTILKKLLLSLLLCFAIALCWLLIIHTLKWISLRGLRVNHTSSSSSSSSSLASLDVQQQFVKNGLTIDEHSLTSAALTSSDFDVAIASVDASNNEQRLQHHDRRRQVPQQQQHQSQPFRKNNTSTTATTMLAISNGLPAAELQHRSVDTAAATAAAVVAATMHLQANSPNNNPTTRLGRINTHHHNHHHQHQNNANNINVNNVNDEINDQNTNENIDENINDPNRPILYKAPFFTSWFVSIWNILFMPAFALISHCFFRGEDSATKKILVRESVAQFMDNGLTLLQFIKRCAFFSLLWMASIFGIVYSLSNLDATVVLALYACSAPLAYLLSWVLLHQQFVGVRIVAVIICTTGVALLAYMDNSRTLGSVLIVAGGALCSAIYKVMYQRIFGFWSIAQMSLFFTFVGFFNAFIMWPVALMLYFLGFELIVWRYIPWLPLIAVGSLNLLVNVIVHFGPICSFNVFLNLGLLVAVALSAAVDVNYYKIPFYGMKLAGVLLLMKGFLICLLPDNWNEFFYTLVNQKLARWKKRRGMRKGRSNKIQDLSTGQLSRLRTSSGRVK